MKIMQLVDNEYNYTHIMINIFIQARKKPESLKKLRLSILCDLVRMTNDDQFLLM